MKEIKVFIAGSKSLTVERDAIRSVLQILSNSNSKKVLIRTYTYEEFDQSLSHEGRQKEYNRFIKSEADYVIFVLDGTVGGITLTEFDIAWKTFTSEKRPGIYVYHKPTNTTSKGIQDVIGRINQCEQYYTEYSDIENLKLKVESAFRRVIDIRVTHPLTMLWVTLVATILMLLGVGMFILKNKLADRPAVTTVTKAIATTINNSAENEYEYVDLGLSVKWATCNVGASSPIEKGSTFAWGEVLEEKYHNWEFYKYSRGNTSYITKYCDNETLGVVDRKTKLELTDDAAYVNWGTNWRIPTKKEFEELQNKCSWKLLDTINNVKGYLVIGKNGKSIFLPFNGYVTHTVRTVENTKSYIGHLNVANNGSGYYWTSSLDINKPTMAWGFLIDSNRQGMTTFDRYCGLNIRPVYCGK